MDLIKSTNAKYDEYESLLLERDQLRKDAGSIWVSYTQIFGQLIADVYEKKIDCIKLKKTIAYYQTALNHGGVVDQDAMQKYLDQEMAAYNAELKRMLEQNEQSKKARTSSPYEVQRAKTLYRRLAKLIHPDINPETDRQDTLKELWQRILTAYGHNDVKELSELEILTRKALEELGAGAIRIDIPDIEDKIDELKAEIQNIQSTEPYTYKDLLENEEAVEKKKTELTEELASYKKYQEELEEIINQMLRDGGITLQWVMK